MPDQTTDPPAHLGWSPRWQALLDAEDHRDLVPGRVVRADRGSVVVATRAGAVRAAPAERLRAAAAGGAADLPAVGDWVALRDEPAMDVAQVQAVLARTGAVERADPGGSGAPQVLAANVDLVLVVHPIDAEPNLRRIERELALGWDSGAIPLVVLTKADLSEDAEAAAALVASVALGVEVVALDARSDAQVAPLRDRLAAGLTAVVLGPSGAGKSTLVNALLGAERQATQEVRAADRRGRHTTVTRELLALPGGGVIIDTPGLRALGLTSMDEGIRATFSEIEALAAGCRFRDCSHEGEPGCAVRAAVEAGALDPDRLAAFHKLRRESEVAAARGDARLRAEEQRRAKAIGKAVKDWYRLHPR